MNRVGKIIGTVVLLAIVLGGGCPRQSSPADEQRVREIVRDELRTGRAEAVIEQLTREAGIEALVEEALASPAVETRLARMAADFLASPDGQDTLSSQIKELLGTPEVQAALSDAVRQELMRLIGQGGAGGG